jgi:hypothetical protein
LNKEIQQKIKFRKRNLLILIIYHKIKTQFSLIIKMIIKFSLINLLLILELIISIIKHKRFNKTLIILHLTSQQNSFKVCLKNKFNNNFKMNKNKMTGLILVSVMIKILGSKPSKLPYKILWNSLLINQLM